MDDVLCGAASLMEAKAFKNQLSGILKRGGMELNKWGSSHPELVSNIFGDPRRLECPGNHKRIVFYFQNRSRSLKIDWIDELPSERAKESHRFLEDFNSVSSICIGSCIVHPQATRVELLGFADALEKCYGAVKYCRSQSPVTQQQ
ncbi:uncharacterized protein TNCV_4162901 [Trichonephila clavipes]|nr:uncharacterized protein TNCV_4162901 [Trichonephila clavipes]